MHQRALELYKNEPKEIQQLIEEMFTIIDKCDLPEEDLFPEILIIYQGWKEVQQKVIKKIQEAIANIDFIPDSSYSSFLNLLRILYPEIWIYLLSCMFDLLHGATNIFHYMMNQLPLPEYLILDIRQTMKADNLKRKDFVRKLQELIRKFLPESEKAQMPAFELNMDMLSNIAFPMFEEVKNNECLLYMKQKNEELEQSVVFMECVMESLALQRLLRLFTEKG